MDYTSGTDLVKHQWDAIHDPGLVIGMFEKEQDAMLIANTYYWTPAGTPIYMPKTATTVLNLVKLKNGEHLNGILYSWKEDKTTYTASIDLTKNMFYGYVKDGTEIKYPDHITLKKGDNITVNSIMYVGNCTKEDILTQYIVPENINGTSDYNAGKPLITTFSYTKGTIANILLINNCSDNPFTGKAKDFKEYCTSKFSSDQFNSIDKTSTQIQIMGKFYDDYEKIVLSTNPYSTWVNTPENLEAFYTALAKYYEGHKNAPLVDNPNCSKCPKYPVVGDSYWDEAGRNWVFVEGNKWKDLTGEFCEEDGCNNEWKQELSNEQIQKIHQSYYYEKLRILENDSWQRSLGINDGLKKHIWRATQFTIVSYLKEKWVAEQVGDRWWNLLFGNVKNSYYKAKVANGDQTFYTEAAFDGVFAAVDVFLLESIAKGLVWDLGIKYLIIEGGAKQLGNKLYYTACKQAISYRLAYALRFGTPEATAFFNKQLVKTIEIFDLATGRYIKFDPASGETFVGKVLENEKSIDYEGFGTIVVSSDLTEIQQANYVVERMGTLIANNVYKEGDVIANRIIKGVRQGTNGKIAIIGRQMEGHVRDIANVLKAEGKQAEVFADIDQAGKIFNIEGKNYKWDEIVDDFKNLNGKYKTNEKGWIIESELSSTLMYKANNQWAEKLVVEGYTVLDFSFPVNIYSESIFYDMELSIIFK